MRVHWHTSEEAYPGREGEGGHTTGKLSGKEGARGAPPRYQLSVKYSTVEGPDPTLSQCKVVQ